MSNTPEHPRIHLPQITKFELHAFDLYARNPNASISLNRNVFCLIGANGLGKSTFLNTLLYALTAAIPTRSKGFPSAREYFKEARRRDGIDDYFDGRISDEYRDLATVSCELRWPELTVRLTRPIFGLGEVSKLEIKKSGDHQFNEIAECVAETLEERYRTFAAQYTGLKSFEQFVFLWHFVCAFDEDRDLLLWNPAALTNVLYLAFGSNADQEREASDLRRKVERLDSRARNSAYAAKQARDNAKNLSDILGEEDSWNKDKTDSRKRYLQLEEQHNKALDRFELKVSELRKVEAQVSNLSAVMTELKMEYEDVYVSRAMGNLVFHHHPLIRSTVSTNKCAVCGTEAVGSRIESLLKANQCPLCQTPSRQETDDNEALKQLQALDGKMEKTRNQLSKIQATCSRLRVEVKTSEQSQMAAQEALAEFLNQHPNPQSIQIDHSELGVIKSEINRHLTEAEKFMKAANEYRRERNKSREILLIIERDLISSFSAHSGEFIRLFRKYAEQFIGLDVDVELEHHTRVGDTGFKLLLSLSNQRRSVPDAVSESQRFFLDIALRMALMDFMSEPSGTLLIDTPEGSLDISYEAQAGEMFSSFASSSNYLIMTANLRSSELVLRLAKLQTVTGMQFERMTEWSDLSEVQRKQDSLFEQAYDQIETALG